MTSHDLVLNAYFGIKLRQPVLLKVNFISSFVDFLSESSPVDDPYNQFQRDSFARRSFSERHKGGGSLDTKQVSKQF